MTSLTTLQRDALSMLVAGDEPVLDAMRKQLLHATLIKQEKTTVGFFCHFTVPPQVSASARLPASCVVSGVYASVRELKDGIGFALFVRDGAISMFEGFTYGTESWPHHIETYDLAYASGYPEIDIGSDHE